ncbi:AfsR/SARP family transcriptional regulator [Cohnella terricola]|uniref:Bacterial transcriptional activator domain-containing protein n=1 Tax=Cohnella terricola TaxID=1289167 RepID=A0A559IUZ9_9BACL|nr:BTAD domain-containing putative transcriptional regulator [Cohnella terricola]TVX91450.1 hypothetical protein FPZ45_25060 [Cohnella terricola]
MRAWTFRLLGGFRIAVDGETIASLSAGKISLLLAYLILADDLPISRKRIAFDFWPDSTERQALANLRKLLYDLRDRLPQADRLLKATPAFLLWEHETPIYSDVKEFELAARGVTLPDLYRAAELYRGELMPGYNAEWLEAKRQSLAQKHAMVLEKIVTLLESRGEYSSAVFYANQLLQHNQLREETYRSLMRLHGLSHDMAGVVRAYRQACSVLQTELGIAPSDETKRLYEKFAQSQEATGR